MADRPPDLGELERQVMQLVWQAGETTSDAIRERLARKPKESTVRTVLRRLEDKGYITHTVDGRTYVFRAAEPRPRVAAGAVKGIVDWLCDGSVEEVLVGMVDAHMLDRGTLQRLARRIEEAKNENKKEKKKEKTDEITEEKSGGKR
jgi:BlaI family transcriptional regulator, penicillinase repressor